MAVKRVPTGCRPLDELLGGGIEAGVITHVYGEAGSGKTNICLQFAVAVARQGGRALFVDTEGVSPERLAQIAGGDEKLAKRIMFTRPLSLEEQEKAIAKLGEIEADAAVVDTINMYLRLRFSDDPEGTDRSGLRQLEKLTLLAHNRGIPVLVTSQVYSNRETGEIRPFSGLHIEYIAKTILRLEAVGVGKRRATLLKSRSLKEQQSAEFTITAKGIE